MKESALTSSNRLGGAVISDRIVASLLEELRTGRYARADRLPAEVDLSAELGVSRTVIRDALSEMERAGYVERVRGIGTVVNRAVLSLRSRLDQKLEYYPLIRSFGSYPHADGIQVFPIRAGEELAHDLEIEPGDDVICIKKRILADTTPVIYSQSTVRCQRLHPHRPDRRRVRYSGTGVPPADLLQRRPPEGKLRRRCHPLRHAPCSGRGHAAAGRSVFQSFVPPGDAFAELLHKLL